MTESTGTGTSLSMMFDAFGIIPVEVSEMVTSLSSSSLPWSDSKQSSVGMLFLLGLEVNMLLKMHI